MKIEFTIEQLYQLLNAFGEIPFKYSKPLVEFVTSVSQPQLEAQQKAQQGEQNETPAA